MNSVCLSVLAWTWLYFSWAQKDIQLFQDISVLKELSFDIFHSFGKVFVLNNHVGK